MTISDFIVISKTFKFNSGNIYITHTGENGQLVRNNILDVLINQKTGDVEIFSEQDELNTE